MVARWRVVAVLVVVVVECCFETITGIAGMKGAEEVRLEQVKTVVVAAAVLSASVGALTAVEAVAVVTAV